MLTPEEEIELLRLKKKKFLLLRKLELEGPGHRGGWDLPGDFLDMVIGYDRIKAQIRTILTNGTFGGNILLIGVPGSGKSLIFSEVSQLDGSYFTSGRSASGAGLTDVLFERQPRILIVDEVDKMDSKDYQILLHLAQTGVVQETKVRPNMPTGRSMNLFPIIFAGANDDTKLSAEFRDRFLGKGFYFHSYTESEFHTIVITLLLKRYGIPEFRGRLIASEAWSFGKSVREAERCAKLCNTEHEIREYFETLRQYT